MKSLKIISFLFLVILFFPISSQSPSDDVLINRISNDPIEGKGNQQSSMAGGTVFYIRGSGFDKMASNNMVFMGTSQATVIGKFL